VRCWYGEYLLAGREENMTDDMKRALLGDHEAAKRLTDAGVLVPCMCGRTPKEHGPEDWKPTFYDPDSGGDPVSIECECGINFSIWSYDYYKTRLAWNTRTPILSAEELQRLEAQP
jgi:hypothetical protein